MKESVNMQTHSVRNLSWYLVARGQSIEELDLILELYPEGVEVYDSHYKISVWFVVYIGQRSLYTYRSNRSGRAYSVYGLDKDICHSQSQQQNAQRGRRKNVLTPGQQLKLRQQLLLGAKECQQEEEANIKDKA